MTYVPGISQSYTAASQSSSTAAENTTSSKTLGQDEFLTLLVAQLQNQDPLNPTDATEFTAQLASYSQLEQLFNLNDSIEDLAANQETTQKISALSMIGKEVLVEDSTFTLDESGYAEIGYRVDGTASDITLTIKDSAGRKVATLHPTEYGDGNHFLTWQAVDEQGEKLPPGQYSIVVDAQANAEGETVGVAPLVRSTVTGVDLSDQGDGTLLLTENGEFVLGDIYGVYENDSRQNTQDEEETGTDSEESSSSEVSAATDGSEMIGDTGTASDTDAIADAFGPVTGG